jgi:hypothetical protein
MADETEFVKLVNSELKASEVKTGKYIGLGETSIKKYIDKLKYFIKNGALDDDLLGFINAIQNVNSRLGYFTAVAGLVKHSLTFKEHLGDSYDSIQKAYSELTEENRKKDTSEKTEKETENWIDWKDILLKTKMVAPFENVSQEQVLTQMYTLIPPVRLDYDHIEIVKHPNVGSANYIQIKNKQKIKLVLKEYKTSETYGAMELDLPVKLCKIINAYLASVPNKKFLFSPKGSLDKPFKSADTFGKYLRETFKGIFDKNISVDQLRHSYITYIRRKDLSKDKKQKIAKTMGHSLEMQEDYRKK